MLSGRIEPHGSSMATFGSATSIGPGRMFRSGRRTSAPLPAQRGRRLRGLSTLVLVASVMTGCVGQPPEVTVDDPELVLGRAIYWSNCSSCHGMDGGGASGGALRGGLMNEAYPDIDDQIEVVTNGREQMPAYIAQLTEEQIRAVVRYTREVL